MREEMKRQSVSRAMILVDRFPKKRGGVFGSISKAFMDIAVAMRISAARDIIIG